MSNAQELHDLINKLANLSPDQLDTLLNNVNSEPQKKRRGRPPKKAEQDIVQINPQKRNGSLIRGPRVNEFDTSGLKDKCANDTKTDKILNRGKSKKKREPEPSRTQKVQARCKNCKQMKEAYSEVVWKDFETNELTFTCDQCDNRRR